MQDLWQAILAQNFMPHGHCYLWQPGLVWLQVLSNAAIGVAYVVISCLLAGLVYKIRDDLPFRSVYLAFGTFIVSCGVTHFFDILTIWKPVYWLDGIVRALTAVASVGTACMLPPLLPRIRDLARGARAARARGIMLETAVRDLEAMYRKSQSVERLKTEFFANVSHELRTPLTLILGPLEALANRTDLPDDARQDLAMAQRNTRILLRQVGDILDSAKLEAGMTPLLRARLDMAQLVWQTCEPFAPMAKDRRITLRVQTPDTLLADVDGDKLERILLNLLSNAFKHTPNGGTVVCALQASGPQLQLEVRNSGSAIPQAVRERIFERFVQVEGEQARAGTGLGLAIVRDYAVLHGGHVEVTDAAEGGARFIITLSLQSCDTAAVAPAPPPRPDSQAYLDALAAAPIADAEPAADPKLPRVLIAEDNVELNHFLRTSLQRHYSVESAADGREALTRAQANPPDLIVSDWNMPGLSGEELLGAVRSEAQLAAIPFLLITARNNETDRVTMLQKGAHDYLAKPFHLNELLARVANLIAIKRTRDVLLANEAHGHADASLEHLAAEVNQHSEALTQQKHHAEALAQAKSDFVDMVAHELRSPVAAMGLQIARLQRQGASMSEVGQKVVQQLDGANQRLARLLDALLLHSRAEAGALPLRPEAVHLGELVEELVEELTPLAVQQRLVLVNKLGTMAEAQTLETDPTLMRIIVRNLLSNAIKFTQPGGRVEISSETEADKTVIAVTDNGPGIHQEDQSSVFEPFVHLEPVANKHTPGMGLGLSLVRTMTQALGGHVELSSTRGSGATFKIVLG